MRKILITVSILLVSVIVASADEFPAAITKVDGGKLTMKKLGQKKKGEKAEEVTLTAADNVKVFKVKDDGKTKKVELGEAVEGGLKNKLFNKATVTAQITTDGDKVTQIIISHVQPDNEFQVTIRMIDGNKIAFAKGIAYKRKVGDEMVLTAADNVKVTLSKFDQETKKFDTIPVQAGLGVFDRMKLPVVAVIVVNDDNKIAEIRLFKN